jgi:hypothetical protein
MSKPAYDRQVRNQDNRNAMAERYGSTFHVDPVPTPSQMDRIQRKAQAEAAAWSRKQAEQRAERKVR